MTVVGIPSWQGGRRPDYVEQGPHLTTGQSDRNQGRSSGSRWVACGQAGSANVPIMPYLLGGLERVRLGLMVWSVCSDLMKGEC